MEMKKKKNEKRGVGCKKGGWCVLSTSTCVQDQRLHLAYNKEPYLDRFSSLS